MKKPRHNDAAYKRLFSSPLMVSNLIKGFVPDPWLDRLDPTTLTPVPTELVDDALKRSHADQIWRAKSPDQDGDLFIHIEYQSNPQKLLALRMAAYSAQILLRELRQNPAHHPNGLPPVLSLVLYNGHRRWRASTQLAHHFRPVPCGRLKSAPRHQHVLIDIHGQDADRLAKLEAEGNLVALVMRFERPHQRSDIARVLLRLDQELPEQHPARLDIAAWARAITGNSRIVTPLLDAFVNPKGTAVNLVDRLKQWEREDKALLAQGRLEGRKEGRQEGRQEGGFKILSSQLTKRFGPIPPEIHAKLSTATPVKLERWGVSMLDASTLDEVFKPQRRSARLQRSRG